MCLFQFWFPQGKCLGVGLLSHMVVLFLVFKESPYRLPLWLYQFTFPPTVQEGSLFSTLSPPFIICRFFGDGHSDQCEGILPKVSIYVHVVSLLKTTWFYALLCQALGLWQWTSPKRSLPSWKLQPSGGVGWPTCPSLPGTFPGETLNGWYPRKHLVPVNQVHWLLSR